MSGDLRMVHVIVFNGIQEPTDRVAALGRTLAAHHPDSYAIASINEDVGYVRAVQYGLALAQELSVRDDRLGFLDADAYLNRPEHWAYELAALERDPELDAISGMVVHEHCGVWESLSSASVVHALEQALKRPLTKPYLQGGAAGSLSRWEVFSQAVAVATGLGTLIGPTLSASSIANGRRVYATSALTCGHTVRRTLAEWVESVTNYERSWRRLVKLYGGRIEQPWQEFLAVAEDLLTDQPALLRDIRRSVMLRREVVARVEAEYA